MYYSEIGKIIEAGLERDKDKVASFAQLLAKKMAADGEERGSKRIGDILERKNRSKAVTDSLIAPPPVDQESRMNIVEIDYQPVVNDLILSKAVELKLMDFMETINNKEKMDQIGLGICSVLDLSKAVIFPARKSVFSGNTLAIVTSLFPAVQVKRIDIRMLLLFAMLH